MTPFYLITGGNPWAGAIATTTVNLLTTISAYTVASFIYNRKTGFITGLTMALLSSITSWSAMHLWFLGWWLLYFGVRLIKGETRLLPFISLLFGLAINVHLVPASLVVPFIFALIVIRGKLKLKDYILSLILFCLPFTPILVFDIRHDFLNIRKLMAFGENSPPSGDGWLFIKVWWRSLNIFRLRNEFEWGQIIEKISLIGLTMWGIKNIKDNNLKIFMGLWWMAPIIILAKYGGAISEYYYNLSMLVAILSLGNWLTGLRKLFTVTVLTALLVIKINAIMYDTPMISYQDKYSLASYLSSQTKDEYYNISYNMEPGLNNGFDYIFKYLGKEPRRGSEGHLYTIVLLPTNETGEMVFQINRLGLVRK